MKCWYLVHCKPREDARALEHLQRQEFRCYLPVRTIERRRNGCIHTATEALFPGYLFIQMDCARDNWSCVRSTRGVRQIVSFGGCPLPVADAIIKSIRARLAEAAREPYLRPGERVKITEGAFSQLEAIFVANDGQDRVVLLLNILQRNQELSFPLEAVRKLG